MRPSRLISFRSLTGRRDYRSSRTTPQRYAVLRRLVNKAFTARRIAQIGPWIRENAAEMVDAMGEGEADVIDSLAIPPPVWVIARLLGVPGSDYLTFKR